MSLLIFDANAWDLGDKSNCYIKTTLDIKVFPPKLAKIFLSRISVFYRKVKMCLWEMRRTWVIVLAWLGNIQDRDRFNLSRILFFNFRSSKFWQIIIISKLECNIETQVASFSPQCHYIHLSDETEDILRSKEMRLNHNFETL